METTQDIAKEVAQKVIVLEDLKGDKLRSQGQTLYFQEAIEFLEEFSKEFLFQMGYSNYKVEIKALSNDE
jgi:hypothetical protein